MSRRRRTVAHNCHIKTKCSQQITNRSHQIQIAHSKFKSFTANYKSLTSNSNRSQQIQIAHSKFKSLTANYKSLTANYKSLIANSNRPQQIQIVHSKLKSLRANSDRRLRLSTASGATRLKIFVIHEAATL